MVAVAGDEVGVVGPRAGEGCEGREAVVDAGEDVGVVVDARGAGGGGEEGVFDLWGRGVSELGGGVGWVGDWRGPTSLYPRFSTRGLRPSVMDWVEFGLMMRMRVTILDRLLGTHEGSGQVYKRGYA